MRSGDEEDVGGAMEEEEEVAGSAAVPREVRVDTGMGETSMSCISATKRMNHGLLSYTEKDQKLTNQRAEPHVFEYNVLKSEIQRRRSARI